MQTVCPIQVLIGKAARHASSKTSRGGNASRFLRFDRPRFTQENLRQILEKVVTAAHSGPLGNMLHESVDAAGFA